MKNSALDLFSEPTKQMVTMVRPEAVQSIDDLLKIQEATDKSHKLHAILDLWSKQQTEERKLRKLYAICFAILLVLQTLTANAVFILVALGLVNMTESQFNIFFVSVFGEMVALVLIVTKYLFCRDENSNLVEKLEDI